MVQLKYPSDTLDGDASWSKAGGPSTIDECLAQPILTADDSKKVTSTSGDPFQVELDAPLDPNERYDAIVLRVRGRMSGPDTCDVDVELYEGVDQRDIHGLGTMPTSWTDFDIPYDFVGLGITDYSALSVRFVPNKSTSDTCEFSAVELEVPDRRAHVHVST